MAKYIQIFKIIIICFLFTFSAIVNLQAENVPNKKLQKIKLQLKWKHQFQFAGYYAAIEKGFYKNVGLDVELIEADENTDPTLSVFNHKAQFGVSNSDIIRYKASGHKPIVLASIFQHSPLVILASKNSGINHIHDLLGKRILIEPNAADVYALFMYESINSSNLLIENHSFDVTKMLDSSTDAITAYLTDEPFVLQQNNFDYTIISPLSSGIDFYGDILFSDEDFVSKNPELTAKFLKASLLGWNFAMKNPDEIIDLILKKYSTRHSKEHLIFEANQMQKFILPNVVEIGYINPNRWQRIIDTYEELKIIDQNNNLLENLLYQPKEDKLIEINWFYILPILISFLLISYIAYYFFKLNKKLNVEIETQKILQKNLTESESRYRVLTENMKDVVWIIDIELMSVKYISPSIFHLLGYGVEEFSGLDIFYSMTDSSKIKFRKIIENSAELYNSNPDKYYVNQFEHFSKEGKIVNVEVIMNFIKNSFTNKIELHGVTRDINDWKKAEELLVEQAGLLDKILESFPYPFYVIDVNTYRIIKSNSKAKIEFKHKEDFECFCLIENFDKPCSENNLPCPMKIALGTKRNVVVEQIHIDKDGNQKIFEFHGYPIFNEKNEIYNFIEYYVDISVRKKYESELRKLSTALEQTPASIVITDLAGNIEYTNPKFTQVTGYSKEEALGKNPRILKSGNKTSEEYKELWETINKGKEWKGIFENNKKNGEIYYESATISPIIDNEGFITHYLAVKEDITEKLKIEQAIIESESKYRLLTEFASDVIWVLNLNKNKFTYISPTVFYLRGIKSEDAINESLEEAISADSIELVKNAITQNLQEFLDDPSQSKSYYNEIQQYHNNGSLIWVEVSTKFRYNKDGEIEIVGVSRNIDDRKKIENELKISEANLRTLNNTKDKFFSIIAHDLRNPIGSFTSFTNLLIQSYDDFTEDERKLFLNTLKDSAENVYGLLENLLQWSMSQRGSLVFNPTDFDLNELVKTVFMQLYQISSNKKLSLVNEIPLNFTIYADYNLFSIIIRNLISNSIKFTNENGEIVIGVLENYDINKVNSIIFVKDNGIGMNQTTIDKLFKIDETVTTLGTNDEKGSGLGLILCKEFIEKHNGSIWVDSQTGIGSTFYLKLPQKINYE